MNARGIAWRSSFHERVNFQIAPVLMVMSAVITAVSAIQQGEAAEDAAEHQARVAENNAIAARQQAEFDERQQREKARLALSAQRARAAKSGVLTEGSPLFLNGATSEEAEIGALNIRRGGQLRANDYGAQAALGRFKGASAAQAGYMQAGSSLLGAAGKLNLGSFSDLAPSSSPASAAPTDWNQYPMQDFGTV